MLPATRRLALFGVALAALAALAGCGGRQDLRPPPGKSLPAAPAGAAKAPSAEELLDPPPLARPERVTESVRRSEDREEDRFDLPPPG